MVIVPETSAITPTTTPARPLLFQPYTLRRLTLRNRIVVSPMCQYSCEGRDGLPTAWHLVHLGTRAVGGAGLIVAEAAAVAPEGRISPYDLGLWTDEQADALAPIVTFVRAQGASIGAQLAHAGRKASVTRPWEGSRGLSDAEGGWPTIGPSPIAFSDRFRVPTEMDREDIQRVREAFRAAARRADRAGFDVVEVHAAHGYLLHQFLSPLANGRTDEYGGSFDNRVRLVLEVVDAVRAAWPDDKPLFVRISATDWAPGGWDTDQSVRLARLLAEHGTDLVDASSGGLVPYQDVPTGPGYQVPLAERIRREAGIATGAVGLITTAEQAEAILEAGQADLVLLGRELLRNPYFPYQAASALGVPETAPFPNQYLRAR